MKKLLNFKMTKKQILISSSILVTTSFVLNKLIGYHYVTIALMLLTALIAGLPILKRAIVSARYLVVGIDALVSIAVIGAIIIQEYWEAAAVTFLFMLGDYLESRTIEKTRSSIRSLLDLSPDTARIKRGDEEVIVSPDEVVMNDLVVIRPGEKIPVDGKVIEGSAYINQSAITGESMPIFKELNDSVFSGTIIESGYLIVEAEKVGEDTTFARILHMVEDAADKKAKTQKFLERFSKYYTPAIILMSIIFYFITKDIRLALTLLVISCPGALVISAPVSIVAGIGNGAKKGVLVKGGDIMEKLGTVKVIAFDKTGTLTTGQPRVTRVKSFQLSEKKVLEIAAAGEAYSEHPLAKAIINRAKEVKDNLNRAEESTIITGQGISFTYEDKDYLIGNRKLLNEEGINYQDLEQYIQEEESKGQTLVILADKSEVIGIISIADAVRQESLSLVSDLKKKGIKKTVMLTGDNGLAAKEIARQTGMDDYYFELLPEDKVNALNELSTKYGRTAMVGDGVNDAPALASADLGIAIGHLGADVAMETADVVLMSENIDSLSYAIGLSRATVFNMKQNIYFALAVSAFLLAGVLFKKVNLSLGMLIHELSVFLVVVNAVRLLGYKERRKKV